MMTIARGETPSLRFGPLFTDHMVIQRGIPCPVRGYGEPGTTVEVRLAGVSATAEVDARGVWTAMLGPIDVGGPHELTAIAGAEAITVRDVMIGDVWICAGQSNMAFPLKDASGSDLDIPSADGELVRFFNVAPKASLIRLEDLDEAAQKSGWLRADPRNAGSCSAVAYHFATELTRRTGVPIGLVVAAWGGTPIGAWTPVDVLAKFDFTTKWLDSRKEAAERIAADPEIFVNGPEILLQTKAGTLFDGMIAPLAPIGFRGFLWYQGEQNAGAGSDTYTPVLKDMVQAWREHLGNEKAPFFFVQLPNYTDKHEGAWPKTREARMMALDIPDSGMAVTIDLGEAHNIHPRAKTEVGRRLARIALAKVHKLDAVNYSGPLPRSWQTEGGGIRIEFFHANGGLLSTDGGEIREFEVAGPDKTFVSAQAVIDNGAIYVWSTEVPQPVAVRYAWRNNPSPNLANKIGLPAAPFRTDGWPKSDQFEWTIPAHFQN